MEVIRRYVCHSMLAFFLFTMGVVQCAMAVRSDERSVGIADLTALQTVFNLSSLPINHRGTKSVSLSTGKVADDELIKSDPHVQLEIACIRALHLFSPAQLPFVVTFFPDTYDTHEAQKEVKESMRVVCQQKLYSPDRLHYRLCPMKGLVNTRFLIRESTSNTRWPSISDCRSKDLDTAKKQAIQTIQSWGDTVKKEEGDKHTQLLTVCVPYSLVDLLAIITECCL